MTFRKEIERPYMLEMVKAGGQEIIDRAEEIVGTDGLVSSIDLTLYFDDSTGIPELEVHRTHLCQNALRVMGYEKTEPKHSKYQGLNVDIKLADEIHPVIQKVKTWAEKAARGAVIAANNLSEKRSDQTEFVRENPDYSIGNQITIGKYTATCVKSEINTESDYVDYTFCFDTYIDERMPHSEMLIKLDEWFRSYEGFNNIREDVVAFPNPGYACHLRVPYAGEMFGSKAVDKCYAPDNLDGTWKDQWLCMKNVQNRSAKREGQPEYGWLMNTPKGLEEVDFNRLFGGVNIIGNASIYCDPYPYGIRPVFVIRKRD